MGVNVLVFRFLRRAGIALMALTALVFALVPLKPSHAEDGRLVTIYHDGIEQTIVTSAVTVGEALKRAEVNVNSNDLVEPGITTELSAPSYNINVYRGRPVTVVDGSQIKTVITPHTSASMIAEAAGITLYDEDQTSLTRIDDFLTEDGVGLKLTIKRATPIKLVLYGRAQDIRTQVATVGDLLKEKGIVLGAQDGTNLPENTPITDGMSLEVWRDGVETITEEQAVPFSTEFIRDADQPVGYKSVQTSGVAGKQLVTFEVTLRNGKEVSRKQIQNVLVTEPKKQVEVIGVQLGFSQAFQDALARLRMCEAGGHYDRNSGNGYYGAYQFDISTWGGYMGYARADLAPPAVQDQKTYETYLRRGWKPWPTCSVKLGLQDVYR